MATGEPRVDLVRQWPAPVVAVLTVVAFFYAAGWLIDWEISEPEVRSPVIAGREASADSTAAAAPTEQEAGPSRLSLTNVTSGASPVSETMAMIGTQQGRFFVVSAGPGQLPGPEGSEPPASDTLYIFDGASWSYDRISDPAARSFLLPEEIESIQEGGPYDVGFLGTNFGSQASFGDSSYRIREPSLQSERAERTALVAQNPDGERTERTLQRMLGPDYEAYEGYIMTAVSGGDYGIVVAAERPALGVVDAGGDEAEAEADEAEPADGSDGEDTASGASVETLILYSPDGEDWSADEIGPVDVLGIVVGTNAFLVLGTYGDERVQTELSPVFMGQYRSGS